MNNIYNACFVLILYTDTQDRCPHCLNTPRTLLSTLCPNARGGAQSGLTCTHALEFERPLTADDMADLLCERVFSDLFTDIIERATTLRETEEHYRVFYKSVEDILSVEEDEERARQLAERPYNIATHIIVNVPILYYEMIALATTAYILYQYICIFVTCISNNFTF